VSNFNWATATPEERRAHWVTKLRSGEYEQITGFLRTENGNCCLGVLCDIASPGRWQTGTHADVVFNFVFGASNYDTLPPDSILAEVGIDQDMADDLAQANDGGETFDEIATRIATIR
jgi:hypothetical protein